MVKKLLHSIPSRFLKITSVIEKFGDLETMTVEEIVGFLKALEERVRVQLENHGGKLLLTEEEWLEREQIERHQLLFTRDEWMKRTNKNRDSSSSQNNNSRESGRGPRDRSKIRCYNCGIIVEGESPS